MTGKITLITPPDIFENDTQSILFLHLSEEEQDTVSEWLGNNGLTHNINFYVYSGETNLDWLFYALSRCEYKYINIDYYNTITQALGGYILNKNNVYYATSNENLGAIYGHITHNRVANVTKFLEIIFSGNNDTNP
jgi:hypothetical protein